MSVLTADTVEVRFAIQTKLGGGWIDLGGFSGFRDLEAADAAFSRYFGSPLYRIVRVETTTTTTLVKRGGE